LVQAFGSGNPARSPAADRRAITVGPIRVGRRADFEALNRAIALVRLRPVIDRIFPFTEAKEVYAIFEGPRLFRQGRDHTRLSLHTPLVGAQPVLASATRGIWSAMSPPFVLLQDISLTFGVIPLLAGAGLSIAVGDPVCLVGRNGSGKSTCCVLPPAWLSPMRVTASSRPEPRSAVSRRRFVNRPVHFLDRERGVMLTRKTRVELPTSDTAVADAASG
jgi:hypothetical protein